jgi:hypothetical protein
MRLKYLRIATLLAGIALMIGSSAYFARNSMRAAEARSWPRARGRIVESRVETVQAHQVGNAGEFRPRLRYDYSVGGRALHGSTIWLDEDRTFDSAQVAARELAFQEAGTEVEVMYNPRDPHEAALLVDKPTWRYLFLFLLGGLLARLGWRRRQPKPAQELAPA